MQCMVNDGRRLNTYTGQTDTSKLNSDRCLQIVTESMFQNFKQADVGR